MNCNLIKNKIDQLVFENNNLVFSEVYSHIEDCESCKAYYKKSLEEIKIIGLIKNEPELKNPEELTQSILNAITNEEQIPDSKRSNQKIYWLIRQTFAAASISLMLIFGIEQYIVFDKISKRETFIAKASNDQQHVKIQNLISYNLCFNLESINKLMAKDFNKPVPFRLLNRIKLSRLSAIAINEIDKQKIRNVRQELSIKINTD